MMYSLNPQLERMCLWSDLVDVVSRICSIINTLILVLLCTPGEINCKEVLVTDEGQWTVENSIAVRYMAHQKPGESEIPFSPNGLYLGFVVRHGDLVSDSNVYDLYIYRTNELRAMLMNHSGSRVAPFRRLTRRTISSNEEVHAIGPIQWEADGDALTFSGDDRNGVQIFRYHILDDRLEEMTDMRSPDPIAHYQVAKDLVLTWSKTNNRQAISPQYPMEPFKRWRDESSNGERFTDAESALVSAKLNSIFPSAGIDITVSAYWKSKQLVLTERLDSMSTWISPSGEYVVAIDEVEVVLFRATSQSLIVVKRWAVTRCPTPMAAWSPRGMAIAFVGVSEPGVGQRDPISREVPCVFTVRFDEKAPFIQTIPLTGSIVKPISIRWLTEAKFEIRGGHEQTAAFEAYGCEAFRSSVAKAGVPSIVSRVSLRAELRESANSPPQVYIIGDSHEYALLPQDPALQGMWLSKQQPFQWREPDGKVVTGGLYLPRFFKQGHPVPLVVQPYWYSPDRFLPDGDSSTVDAAQLLAANGVAVLKYEKVIRSGKGDVEHEGVKASERLDAAVSALASAGLIDPAKVALTGFSRAGYQAYYILTHPGKTQLSAVVTADAYDGTFPASLIYSAYGNVDIAESENGPDNASFYRSKNYWLEHDILFNVNRVRTPFMVTRNLNSESGHNPHRAFWNSQRLILAGAFNMTRRPLEMLEFPDADHNIRRPRERQAMLSATIGWLTFWLKGVEDSASPTAYLYPRWRTMRAEWARQQAWETAGHPAGSIPAKDFKVEPAAAK